MQIQVLCFFYRRFTKNCFKFVFLKSYLKFHDLQRNSFILIFYEFSLVLFRKVETQLCNCVIRLKLVSNIDEYYLDNIEILKLISHKVNPCLNRI